MWRLFVFWTSVLHSPPVDGLQACVSFIGIGCGCFVCYICSVLWQCMFECYSVIFDSGSVLVIVIKIEVVKVFRWSLMQIMFNLI